MAAMTNGQTLCRDHGMDYLRSRIEIGEGCLCSRKGNYSDAIQCYNRALDIFPDPTEALHLKSLALLQLRKYSEAVTCLDAWLDIEKCGAAYANKGIALCGLGKYHDAVRCFEVEEVIVHLVRDATFYYAYALFMTGQYQAALVNCLAELRLSQHNKAAKRLKKECKKALGQKAWWMFWHHL